MQKRIFTALLSLILILGLLPAAALATDNEVTVKIGSSSEGESMTLAAAVEKAKSSTGTITITLNQSIALASTLDLTDTRMSIILNLNGYSLTADGFTAVKIGELNSAAGVVFKSEKKTGAITVTNGTAEVCAVEVTSDCDQPVKFWGCLAVNGAIRYAGTGKMEIQGATYITGDIINEGSGSLLIRNNVSWGIPYHDGALQNTASGLLAVQSGSYDRDPSTFVDLTQYKVETAEDRWTVTWNNSTAPLTEGYVAVDSTSTFSKSKKYYKTLKEADADKKSTFYLIDDVDLRDSETGGFEFTFSTNSNPTTRILGLNGNTYQGSITDTKDRSTTTGSSIYTQIQGSKNTARSTALLTNLTTKVLLKIAICADVTIDTGSAAGISVDKTSTLTIHGGDYTGAVTVKDGGTLLIDGGTFDEDVTKYCADGYIAMQDASTKRYVVVEIPDAVGKSEVAVRESTEQGATDGSVGTGVDDSKTAEATTIAESVAVDLTETTNGVKISETDTINAVQKLAADKQVKLSSSNEVVPYTDGTSVTVTIIKEPYLEVTVTNLNDTETRKELTLDITPKYNLLATTDPRDLTKTVIVSTGNLLAVKGETEVKLQLPEGFAEDGEKLLVRHEKDDDTTEYYTGSVSEEDGEEENKVLTVTFTTNGFTPFTLSKDYVATIGAGADEKVYPSLQAAVNAAADGDEIKLRRDCEGTVYVNKTVRFTVDPSKEGETGEYTYDIEPGVLCIRKDTGDENEYDIVAPEPESSESHGDGVTNYRLIRTYVEGEGTVEPNGTVMVRDGSDQSFTVTPADGYEIGDVVVNHKSLGAVNELTTRILDTNLNVEVTFVKTGNAVIGTESTANPSTGAGL